MRKLKLIKRNEEGAGAVEFALAAPILFTMVVGIAQLGIFFFANSGLQHAVEEAARRAAVFPTPTNAEILAEVNARRFGLGEGELTPTVTPGDVGLPTEYRDIRLSYRVPLDFIFFSIEPVVLTHSRRVYTQNNNAPPASSTSSTSTSTSGGTNSSASTSSASSTTSTGSSSNGNSNGGGNDAPSSSTTTTSTTSGGSTTSTGNGNNSTGGTSSSSSNGSTSSTSSGGCTKKKC